MALGAEERSLVGGVLRASGAHAVVGIIVGLLLAFLGRKFITAFLFGVNPGDPSTYIAVGILLIVVCFLASVIPARRIMAVEPVKILREE